MDGHVLILNQDYRPIGVSTVQRAVTLVLLEKADLVADKSSRKIRAADFVFPFPSVIRLKRYVSVPYRNVILSRKNILRRDHFRCQYCQSTQRLTIDHVLPRSRGGKDTWENLVTACMPCNTRKGNRTPEEAGITLRYKPYRPSHVLFIRDYVGHLEDEWKPFLFLD
ncbi:MAG: HNH endonuclease [Rhodothermia bacterium]|nr:HNH endonuclease [Rhodothermia bacterium]